MLDLEEAEYKKSRCSYIYCGAVIFSGFTIMLFGFCYLPQSVPQSNTIAFQQESADTQMQELRNYQIASVQLKICMWGLGICTFGTLCFIIVWRRSVNRLKMQYNRLALQQTQKPHTINKAELDKEIRIQTDYALAELNTFELQKQAKVHPLKSILKPSL